jgi:hypothetical protein
MAAYPATMAPPSFTRAGHLRFCGSIAKTFPGFLAVRLISCCVSCCLHAFKKYAIHIAQQTPRLIAVTGRAKPR